MKKNELKEELAKTKAQLENTDKALKEAAEAYEAETLSTAEMAQRITELEIDKNCLISAGEKLVRWVESNRHDHEEIRDHNGRLKDTGIWANFYTMVRGIQRKDTPMPPQNLKPCCGAPDTGECHPTCRHRTHAPSSDRCARLAKMEVDESPAACGPAMLAGLSENAKAHAPAVYDSDPT
jgi:hypothetical protein